MRAAGVNVTSGYDPETVRLALARVAEVQERMALALAPVAEARERMALALAPVAEAQERMALALAPVVEARERMALALAPVAEAQERMALALAPVAEAQRVMALALAAVASVIVDLELSPELEELLDDLRRADDGHVAIEGDFDDTAVALAAHLAVPALIERIKTLNVERSEPALDDAAWRLEREDTLWRTSDDDRVFAMIIHGAVSVLEEVARRIAGQPDANLRIALSTLRIRGTITQSQQRRMMQAWELRNRAAHGTSRAPKEVAGFVLLRVRRGLLDLLNALDDSLDD